MNLQIFSFAYYFLISPPTFELLHLSMVLTYRKKFLETLEEGYLHML